MKSISRKGWKPLKLLRVKGKYASRFCMFAKVSSAGNAKGHSPVYLNVYDLTHMNGYVYWAGFGIFHSGIEVHGVEYAFGAHDYPTSGIFEVEPRQCPGFMFRKSIFMGTTGLDPMQVREFMELLSVKYFGNSYNLIGKNCNHFCKDACYKLTGNSIPNWVNRLARIGALCSCILPEALQDSAVGGGHEPKGSENDDGEKRRLRSTFTSFSSFSIGEGTFPASSLLLQFPPRELRGLTPFH